MSAGSPENAGRYMAGMERVFRTAGNHAGQMEALLTLRRWQFESRLDSASRQKASALVWTFQPNGAGRVPAMCHPPYATCARRAHMLVGRRYASLEEPLPFGKTLDPGFAVVSSRRHLEAQRALSAESEPLPDGPARRGVLLPEGEL